MNDDDAFQRAISESAGDDTTYLVYADWLEERNDPRARLIRAWFELRTVVAQAEAAPTESTFDRLGVSTDAYRTAAANAGREWLWQLGEVRPWIDRVIGRFILGHRIRSERRDWRRIIAEEIPVERGWVYAYPRPEVEHGRTRRDDEQYLVHQFLGTVWSISRGNVYFALAHLEGES